MKKYKVSLAIELYSNFEVTLSARSERKALKMALDKYYSGNYDEHNITEPDWVNSELLIDVNNMDKIGSGIWIEEIMN